MVRSVALLCPTGSLWHTAPEPLLKGILVGTVRESTGESADVSGQFKVPYLAEENADEDPELLVSSQKEDAAHRRAKEAFLSTGKQAREIFVLWHVDGSTVRPK